ncbi:MAG: hypothetical protein RI932_1577 [Pseudomonadota bacterium]|jgi:sodium/potassium-transporting ATPase subunit alpha
MKIQNLSPEAALKSLHSRSNGLHAEEVERRLAEYGLNSIERRKRENLVQILLKELSNTLAIVLWLTSITVFAAAMIYIQEDLYPLGFAIIGVIIINAVFSFWQSLKAERALEALQNILPAKCLVLRSGIWASVSARNLVPGDILSLREGDTAAADVRLLESHALRVDTSHITGESLPSFRHSESDKSEDLLQAHNLVLAGVRIVSGRGHGVIFATGSRTEFGKIAIETLASQKKPSPLQREIAIVSKRIALFSILLGIAFTLLGITSGLPTNQALLLGVAMIVANIPEGLMPTITLSLAFAAQRMSKKNALVRHLPAVEALGATTVICTDKTGTLTKNQLSVKKIDWLAQTIDASQLRQKEDLSTGEKCFVRAIRMAHSLIQTPSTGSSLGDPIEVALVTFARECSMASPGVTLVSEIPFDDTRRRQSVVVAEPDGRLVLISKGAPEVIVSRSHSMINESTDSVCMTDSDRNEVLMRAENYAREGHKVLAYAQRHLSPDEARRFKRKHENEKNEFSIESEDLEVELDFLGLVALDDPIRPEVPDAIQDCRNAGIRVIMITGDHPETARSVSKELGIFSSDNSEIILGHELEHWNMTQLQLALEHKEIAFARVRANQKQRIVEALKNKNHVVAVTGDGVNDAPALRSADVGVAMGMCGTDVARESSDIILLDDNFATIVTAIREGRGIYANIRNFMTYIFSSNVAEALPYVLFMLLPIPLPLTIMQILAIDLGTDLVPAIGLGADPADVRLMQMPPRGHGRHLIDRPFLLKAYLWFGMWLALCSLGGYFFILCDAGWSWGDPVNAGSDLAKKATTATFITVILMQTANVFLCRQQPVFANNKIILAGIALEIVVVLAVLYFSPVKSLLQTEELSWTLFPLIGFFMCAMIMAEHLRRLILRRLTTFNHASPAS